MEKIELKQNKKLSRIILEHKVAQKAKKIALIFWADLVWYVHFAIVILAIVPFFIPESVWQNRVAFHFYYLWCIIMLQIIAGMVYLPKMKKFHFICPLTALEKHLIKRHPHKHVGESCVADFCAEKLGLPKWLGTISVLIALILVTLQHFRII